MNRFLTLLCFLLPYSISAGVYGSLEFGDSRETVTRKLQKSPLVKQTLDSTFIARTGLNGVFTCKNKLAGQTYTLYFDWSESGGLKEITLRSSELSSKEFSSSLNESWKQASDLFSKVYGMPVQDANYPSKSDFKNDGILMTHIWHKGARQSILIGPGIKKGKCFLTIRFVNKRVDPVRTP